MMSTFKVVSIFVGCMVSAIVLLTWATVGLSHHFDSISCTQFGINSNRVVKFVDYSTFSWACLTSTADGRWIDTSYLREVGGDLQ